MHDVKSAGLVAPVLRPNYRIPWEIGVEKARQFSERDCFADVSEEEERGRSEIIEAFDVSHLIDPACS